MLKNILLLLIVLFNPVYLFAGEANLKIPTLNDNQQTILTAGIFVCLLGLLFGIYQYLKVKKLKAHQSMLDVAQIIFETCKTYLIQQGKLLIVLFIFIAVCVAFYFGFLMKNDISGVLLILSWTVIGIAGSYSVAWFGIRMNTLANSRMAFASLERKPLSNVTHNGFN